MNAKITQRSTSLTSSTVASSRSAGQEARKHEAQRRVCLLALAPLLLIMLCGAVPAERGTTVSGSISATDQLVPTGCSATRVLSAPVHGSLRHQYDNGFTITAEATAMAASYGNDADYQGVAAVRLGYHGERAGIELGPSRLVHFEFPDPAQLGWLPSAELWLGRPDEGYVYLRGMSGSISPNLWTEVAMVGVGVKRESFRGSIEVPVLAMSVSPFAALLSPELHGAWKVSPDLWVDLNLGLGTVDVQYPLSNREVVVGITYTPKG